MDSVRGNSKGQDSIDFWRITRLNICRLEFAVQKDAFRIRIHHSTRGGASCWFGVQLERIFFDAPLLFPSLSRKAGKINAEFLEERTGSLEGGTRRRNEWKRLAAVLLRLWAANENSWSSSRDFHALYTYYTRGRQSLAEEFQRFWLRARFNSMDDGYRWIFSFPFFFPPLFAWRKLKSFDDRVNFSRLEGEEGMIRFFRFSSVLFKHY